MRYVVAVIASLVVALGMVFVLAPRAHARWSAAYESSPPEVRAWVKQQRNSKGEWCCDESDGHRYDGDYTINADGSVTVEGETIPKEKVLTGPNPTSSAVWWFLESGGKRTTYCFALGGGV